MEDFVCVPKDLKGFVIGAKGSIIKSIQERSGARVYSLSRDEEGFRVSGTREERDLAKKLILEKVEGGKLKFAQNKSNKSCYFIDDFNLPMNTMLRLEKDYGPPMEYRLRPFHSCGTEESPSLANDPIYLKTLEADVLHSLERIKHEIGTKRSLNADIWCQFGTVLIRQPDEGPGGEWSIENASRKLLEGTEWRTLFRGGVNLDEKFVEQQLCNQSLPEYEDVQSRYDFTFRKPNGGQLTFKVCVIKKNVGKTLESIKIPSTDLKNILDEVCFEDQFTRSRCRGWLILPPQRYLRADILFPGCDFDCRLAIRALVDSGFHMNFVPQDDVRNTLLKYLSKVTFSDEDDFGLCLPDEKLPDGFQPPFIRCSKRAVYRLSEDFSIIFSKESTGVYGRDIKKGTDFHLHCKEWDELLNSENWEPEKITKKLPDFFRFVKKVQSSIIHEMKHEGAIVTYRMKHKEEIADFVDVPQDLKRYVIGTGGNTLRSIQERSGTKVYSLSRAEEGFWIKGTKEQREYAKTLILEMVEGGKVKRDQKYSNSIHCYIDDFNMPGNTNLRLDKEDGTQAGYRLRSIQSYELEESLNPGNDPVYFKDLEVEVLHSLERLKREMETKHHLKADIWCHFGTILIHQPDEDTDGEWSIENAVHKLFEGTKWKTVFKGGINFDEKFVEEHLGKELHPEYDDYLSRYDLAFKMPYGGELKFKVWVTKKNVGEKWEGIPIPYTEVKNILDEVDFHDPFTSYRCRGWLIFRPEKYLRANILFPGCKFDCRLTMRVLADNARDMDLVPKEDTRNALLSYLSKVTFSDEDEFGLRLPDEKFVPDGFKLSFMRCSKRAKYRFSEDFSIVLSKETTASGSGVKKETDFHLHCKEWDELLDSGNWEPAEITKKLPDFFRFVKKVQSSIIHEIKHEGASVPPAIRARGLSAVESYLKALADGKTSLKRVPIMLIGQDRAGKTSLKKSLKGICFDPEEDSTVGIDVDPSYFKVTTDAFRTGAVAEQQDGERDISFDRHAAMKIVHDLRKENEIPLSKTSTEETKSPADAEWERATITDTIQPERHTGHSETYEQMPKKDAPEISLFPSLHNHEARTDFTGILPEEIAVETETLLKGDVDDNREHVFLTLWDFAGQSVYYDTHPIFLTEQAIYCLVYDLSLNPHDLAKPVVKQGVYKKFPESGNLKTNLDYLDFWMWSVASLAGGAPKCADTTAAMDELLPQNLPPVILVCTHADTPYDSTRDPTEIAHEILDSLKSKPYGIHLSDVFVVDNTKSGTESECPEVVSLREEVYDVAKGLPRISETIPIKWLKFDKALGALKEEEKHFVSLETAKDIAESCDIVDDVEFETVMNYLHDLRILIHFDDTPALNELVVLDIQWLIDVFKSVITVKRYDRKEKKSPLWSKLEKEGVLHEKLLSHVWGTLCKKEGLYEGLITIMEKFSLLCPLTLEKPRSYLVPSMLKTRPSSEIVKLVSSAQIPSLFVGFKPEKVPAGFFHRLVLQFFRWGRGNFLSANIPQLFQNVVRFITCGDKICSVIFVCHTSSVEVAICAHVQQKATAYTCASQCATAICQQLGLMLESMRNEFFWLRKMRYDLAVLCPVCCRGGALEDYCDSHGLKGCKEEHCLRFLSLSQLRSAKQPIVCTKPGLKLDVVVDVEQFSPWVYPSGQQHAHREPGVRGLLTKEGLSVLSNQSDGPVCTSRNARQMAENLQCSEGALDNPGVETGALISPRFTREAEYLNSLEIFRRLREITPAGTTVVCAKELNVNVNAEFKTDVHRGAFAAVGTGSQVNLGNLLDATVRPQLTAGQSSYDISVSGGNAAIGDNSEVNVGTGGPSGFPSESSEEQEHKDNRDNRVEDVD